MPNDPIRESVVQAIVEALEAVQAGSAFWYTLETIWTWRTPVSGEVVYPTVGVFDLDETVIRTAPGCAERTLSVTLQGIHAALTDQEPDKVARRLLADIQKAIGQDHTLGGVVRDAIETANRLAVDAPAEPYVVVEVDLAVQYRTNPKDPAARS